MGLRIEARRLTYTYPGRRKPAVDDVSLTLEPGNCYGLVGPNGSGKTTLLKVLSLIYKPSSGVVLFDGTDPWQAEVTAYRRRIVYVHEKPIIVRGTVRDNVLLGLKFRGHDSRGAVDASNRIAGKLDLEKLLDRDARSLSAGQRQIVAIARALVLSPDAVALDEPYSNLDYKRRRLLMKVIDELRGEGRLILISSHDLELLANRCDRMIYMEEGRVVLEGPAREVAGELLHE